MVMLIDGKIMLTHLHEVWGGLTFRCYVIIKWLLLSLVLDVYHLKFSKYCKYTIEDPRTGGNIYIITFDGIDFSMKSQRHRISLHLDLGRGRMDDKYSLSNLIKFQDESFFGMFGLKKWVRKKKKIVLFPLFSVWIAIKWFMVESGFFSRVPQAKPL